jgi:hypothetical protein
MTVTLALNNFFVLIIFYIGVAVTLEDATRLPTELWIAALFGVCLYFLSRKSLNATIATTLMIIFVNIFALLMIPLLALPHFQFANLALGAIPFVGGAGIKPVTLQLIFGIMLSTYFSHMQVATYGPVILRRDPSARSWIQGSVLAILIYMLICCFWLIVINGVISPEVLATTAGTVLSPLAAKIGPLIHLLGSWLVIFSMGLTSVQIALGLYYLVQERLPAKSALSLLGRLSERGRFWLAVSPVAGVFILAEWVALTGFGTFTSLLNFLSVLALPLLSGIFPVLLLAATRRKGDFVPQVVYRLLGSPLVLAAIYLVFLAIIVIHAVFIWQDPLQQSGAWFVVLMVLVATMVMLRNGALRPRTVIELRADQRDQEPSWVALTSAGRPAKAEIMLRYADHEETFDTDRCEVSNSASLRFAQVQLRGNQAEELKIWTHQITPEGDSTPLAATATLQSGSEQQDLRLADGLVILPRAGAAAQATITPTEVKPR